MVPLLPNNNVSTPLDNELLRDIAEGNTITVRASEISRRSYLVTTLRRQIKYLGKNEEEKFIGKI